jgi:hypothetical protein
MARHQSGQIEISTYVDACDVIDELSDEDLLDEVKHRKLAGAQGTYCPLGVPPEGDSVAVYHAWAEELRQSARAGDWTHFEVLLIRMAPIPAREKAGTK